MVEDIRSDARNAAREACECCDRLTSVLQDSIVKAEQLGDIDMLDRLLGAKLAADRARKLVGNLHVMLEVEQRGLS